MHVLLPRGGAANQRAGKRAGECLCSDGRGRRGERREEGRERAAHRAGGGRRGAESAQTAAQLWRHVEALHERVEVAGVALVAQADESHRSRVAPRHVRPRRRRPLLAGRARRVDHVCRDHGSGRQPAPLRVQRQRVDELLAREEEAQAARDRSAVRHCNLRLETRGGHRRIVLDSHLASREPHLEYPRLAACPRGRDRRRC
mmetsp:Transcript_40407/g.130834  ORF Transcript_40407/g.130834 Transcript_40407/m.130834 type:complete len:202 (+) Transcript_40407:368-973(+)